MVSSDYQFYLPRLIDLAFAMICIGSGMLIAEQRNEQPTLQAWLLPTFNDHLGAEYDSIARAIRGGRGFADPFNVESGPTAWMPPALPYFLATLYWLTDDHRTSVIELVLGLKALTLLSSAWILFSESRRLGVVWAAYTLFPFALAANFFQLFQVTHDEWWLLLLANVMWFGAIRLWASPPSKPTDANWPQTGATATSDQSVPPANEPRKSGWLPHGILWGALGGLIALSSPVLGATWAGLTVLFSFRVPIGPARGWYFTAVAAMVSILAVTPWTIRNRVEFSHWLPIKSNGAFEIWQSLCLDDDGLIDDVVTSRHPFPSQGPARLQYLRMGEIRFVESKWPEIFAVLRDNPMQVIDRIARRAVAALLAYYPYSASYERLKWPMLFKRIVHPLPFLAALALLVLPSETSSRRPIQITFAIYALTLAPYIIVSYYDRYAAPLFTIKCLLVLYLSQRTVFSFVFVPQAFTSCSRLVVRFRSFERPK